MTGILNGTFPSTLEGVEACVHEIMQLPETFVTELRLARLAGALETASNADLLVPHFKGVIKKFGFSFAVRTAHEMKGPDNLVIVSGSNGGAAIYFGIHRNAEPVAVLRKLGDGEGLAADIHARNREKIIPSIFQAMREISKENPGNTKLSGQLREFTKVMMKDLHISTRGTTYKHASSAGRAALKFGSSANGVTRAYEATRGAGPMPGTAAVKAPSI